MFPFGSFFPKFRELIVTFVYMITTFVVLQSGLKPLHDGPRGGFLAMSVQFAGSVRMQVYTCFFNGSYDFSRRPGL